MTVVPRIQISADGPSFSNLVQGYWRLADWNMTVQQRLSFLKGHVELGITSVDHAHIYGNPSCESLFGEALKLDPPLRDEIEIISKCGIATAQTGKVAHYNLNKSAILSSVETSLKRLGTDYLDALLLHRPDFLMNADEIAESFDRLKQQGKVKYFGVSNFTSAQFSLLQSRLDFALVTNQIEINPVNLDIFEDGILEDLQRMRIRPMAWSCLGGGEIFRDKSTRFVSLRKSLHEVAAEIGAGSIDQVIYAWVMKIPSMPVPLLGSRSITRVKAAAASLSLAMENEQWYRIWSASKGQAVP
jgi:predicted oxidoreductase